MPNSTKIYTHRDHKTRVTRQLRAIWDEWHDPKFRLKRKFLKNREKRRINKKRDLGL